MNSYKKYGIIYNYSTGDYSGSKRYDAQLEMNWNDLDVAKRNLRRIKEHYIYYCSLNPFDYFRKIDNSDYGNNESKLKKIQAQAKLCDWYTGKFESFKLFTDDNNACIISAPWCGYFEELYWAQIIENPKIEEDMRINFL